MSDDLISRRTIKSLIEMIRDCWAISPYVSANDMKLYSKVFNVVLNEISNCPTVFHKEKVIEKIKDYRELIPSWALREIVEIIDKGGITVTKLDPKSEWISGDSEIRPQNKQLVVCILKNNRIGIFWYKKGVLHNLYVPTYYTWKMVECWMAIGIPSGVRDRVLLGVRKEL